MGSETVTLRGPDRTRPTGTSRTSPASSPSAPGDSCAVRGVVTRVGADVTGEPTTSPRRRESRNFYFQCIACARNQVRRVGAAGRLVHCKHCNQLNPGPGVLRSVFGNWLPRSAPELERSA